MNLNLDALERCPGACGRLLCDMPDCYVMRTVADGTFYRHLKTDDVGTYPENPPVLTVDEYRAMQWGAVA